MPLETENLKLKKPLQEEYYDVDISNSNLDIIDKAIGDRVIKVTGKGLSTNDYTTAEKEKLATLNNYDDSGLRQEISTKADKTTIYTRQETDIKLTEQKNYTDTHRNYTLTHTKLGTVHTLSDLPTGQGIYQCQFIAQDDYTEGDTFTDYTAKPTGEETVLPEKAFVKGDIVSITVDTVHKKLGFDISGGVSSNIYSAIVIGTSLSGHTKKDVDYLCDGVNDEVEISKAIKEAAIMHTNVYLLNGTYNTKEFFTDVSIIGQDRKSVIINIDISSRQGIKVYGSNIIFSNFTIKATNTTGIEQYSTISLYNNVNNIKIENIEFVTDEKSECCFIKQGSSSFSFENIKILNNKFIQGVRAFQLNKVNNIIVENNYFENARSIGDINDSKNIRISNNFSDENTDNAVNIQRSLTSINNNIRIYNNIFKSASILVTDAQDVLIIFNTVGSYLSCSRTSRAKIVNNFYCSTASFEQLTDSQTINNTKISKP